MQFDKEYGLEQHIRYLGTLNEQDMCRQYLKANVFVSASSIENSSNSLSEAMILGVPCIASDAGGTISLFQHEHDGFLYQADAPYLLAYYIDRIFSDDERLRNFLQILEHMHWLHMTNKIFLKEFRKYIRRLWYEDKFFFRIF